MPVNPTISEEHQQDADLVNNEPALNPSVGATRLSGTDSDRGVDAPEGSTAGSQFVERDFFNPHDGLKGRPGGVYLDVQERVRAEEQRAFSEDREPDLDNPPAVAGTTLVTEGMRVDNSLYSNPGSDPVAPVKEVEPVSTTPVDVGIATGEVDTAKLRQHLDEVEARNESVANPDATTAEQGAPPANPDTVSNPAEVMQSNVQTTSSGDSYSV